MSQAILVADQEAGFRDLLAFALEPLGYHVVVVGDGAEALAQVAMRPFDLVVLDQHMPRLDGLQTLQQIHSLVPGIPVVMVSASVERAAVEQSALAAGAAAILFKPIELNQLVDAVQAQLER